MDDSYRQDVLNYAESTLRLLAQVPNQHPDPTAKRDVLSNIKVMQSRLDHLSPKLRAAISPLLQQAWDAAEGNQLGLAMTHVKGVRKEVESVNGAEG